MQRNYLSVQALTKYIRYKFQHDPYLKTVYVRGELSNVSISKQGHIYATLKDKRAQISLMMFRKDASQLTFQPEVGMDVLIQGNIDVYEPHGRYQLYAKEMYPAGEGALYVALRQLHEKLKNEGLFDERWKQPIPSYPETIGIITARTGAAIQDMISTIHRRYPIAKIVLFPVTVQGEQAPREITEALYRAAEKKDKIDVLIVGRGGGSMEDLWAFNSEDVVRAIFSSPIPVVSAVGHETDYTLADYAADVRAVTPTAAAELVTPSKETLRLQLQDFRQRMHQAMLARYQQSVERLRRVQQSVPFQYSERLYQPFYERLDRTTERLHYEMKARFIEKRHHFEQKRYTLQTYAPHVKIREEQKRFDQLHRQLVRTQQQFIGRKVEQFDAQVRMLTSLNPLQVLSRGFTMTSQNDQLVTSIQDVKEDDILQVEFQDGIVTADIKTIVAKKGESVNDERNDV